MIHWGFAVLAFFLGLAFGFEDSMGKKKKKPKSEDEE